MATSRNIKYAKNEVELAKGILARDPDNEVQKDRLAWWSAYLGDLETASKYAVSNKTKKYIESCKTP